MSRGWRAASRWRDGAAAPRARPRSAASRRQRARRPAPPKIISLRALLLAAAALAAAAAREALPSSFDPYATLRVARGASRDAVRATYRRALNVMGRAASRGGHGQEPDASAGAALADLGLAYRVLSDDAWRAEWDGAHPEVAATPPPPAWEFEEEDL